MTAPFEIAAYETMTVQIVHDVFKTMLQYDVHQSRQDYDSRVNDVTSAIFLGGSWKGAVIVECSEKQCRVFASRLMGIPEPERMDNDVRDAMGELANMIGGNLKSVLPPGTHLSMPSVLEGSDYAYRICGSNQVVRFSFSGEAGPLWVTLVQVIEK